PGAIQDTALAGSGRLTAELPCRAAKTAQKWFDNRHAQGIRQSWRNRSSGRAALGSSNPALAEVLHHRHRTDAARDDHRVRRAEESVGDGKPPAASALERKVHADRASVRRTAGWAASGDVSA